MSLHDAAQHLASQGRYGDSMLVHMNPKEVAGLQALAQQKGTTLTRNPHTGLPEAFGFGDLNPFRIIQGKGEIGESGFGSMLIGAALMAAGMPPQMAGLVTGGATLAMGGNMKQALGQGLGAYGGASMAGAAGIGAPSAPPAPGATPPTPAAAPTPPAAAAAATPAPTMPANYEFASSGMDFGGSSAPPPTLAAEQAANQVATATPAPQMGPLTDAQVDVGLGKAGTYTPTGEASMWDKTKAFGKEYAWPLGAAGIYALTQEKPKGVEVEGQHPGFIRPYIYDPKTQGLTQLRPVRAPGYAAGGMPVEQMSNANAVGMNTGYPQADITGHAYATPWQTPVSQNVVQGTADTGVNRMSGQMLATGGLADLGGYSDGGRLLKGPGDGVSDSIPAVIGNKQPARLADGEFVVPARIVSELGNGSTEAGARQLYGMMDRIQKARGKTTGKNKVAANTRADKYLPA